VSFLWKALQDSYSARPVQLKAASKAPYQHWKSAVRVQDLYLILFNTKSLHKLYISTVLSTIDVLNMWQGNVLNEFDDRIALRHIPPFLNPPPGIIIIITRHDNQVLLLGRYLV
jgi:hypothetical protein